MRAAVVGAGPSGFYAADQLLRAGFEVDLLDALPTPFGLVRAGVAPDHPKIKSVTRVYEKTARRAGLPLLRRRRARRPTSRRAELLERYHAVVYAVGTRDDNRLGIPGEDRPGSHAATEFVAWYNGHPDARRPRVRPRRRARGRDRQRQRRDRRRADARARPRRARADRHRRPRDRRASARSAVREVVLLGRRGPAQAAFTNPELRELGELHARRRRRRPGRRSSSTTPAPPGSSPTTATRPRGATSRSCASTPRASRTATSHRVELRFLRSPVEILGDGEDGRGHRRARRASTGSSAATTARCARSPTGEEEVIACGLVLRSIGYRGRPLRRRPVRRAPRPDPQRGRPRRATRTATPRRGEYAVGWIKRGPQRRHRHEQEGRGRHRRAHRRGRDAGRLDEPPRPGADADRGLAARARAPASSPGRAGRRSTRTRPAAGEPHGRPRVKLVRVPDMLAVASAVGSWP